MIIEEGVYIHSSVGKFISVKGAARVSVHRRLLIEWVSVLAEYLSQAVNSLHKYHTVTL